MQPMQRGRGDTEARLQHIRAGQLITTEERQEVEDKKHDEQ